MRRTRGGERKREKEVQREMAKYPEFFYPSAKGLQCIVSSNATDEEMSGQGMGALNLKCIKLIPFHPPAELTFST